MSQFWIVSEARRKECPNASVGLQSTVMPASFGRYLIEIERHLEVSNRPSAMAMMLLRTVGLFANDSGAASPHVLAGEPAAFQLGGGFGGPWPEAALVCGSTGFHADRGIARPVPSFGLGVWLARPNICGSFRLGATIPARKRKL